MNSFVDGVKQNVVFRKRFDCGMRKRREGWRGFKIYGLPELCWNQLDPCGRCSEKKREEHRSFHALLSSSTRQPARLNVFLFQFVFPF